MTYQELEAYIGNLILIKSIIFWFEISEYNSVSDRVFHLLNVERHDILFELNENSSIFQIETSEILDKVDASSLKPGSFYQSKWFSIIEVLFDGIPKKIIVGSEDVELV